MSTEPNKRSFMPRSRSRSQERTQHRGVDHGRQDRRDERRDNYEHRLRHSRSRSPPRQRNHRSRSRSPRARSRSRSKDKEEKHKRRGRSRSVLSDNSSSSERRRRRRKEKRKERSSRSRERKERKREKKREKKKKGNATASQWGRYGIISETDIYNKEQEFRTWLVEERKINPETVSKDQNRKEFARFVEDFNTATLPHEKYYDMTSYDARMSALRQGEFVPPPDDSYDANVDLRAHQSRHKRTAGPQESYLSREQLQELRRVQSERVELGKMKLLGMEVKQNMGVRMDSMAFEE